jgi:hypothetical protein
MPKKTKKEKILAEYRRKLKLLKESTVFTPKPQPTIKNKKEEKILPQSPILPQTKKLNKEDNFISSYFVNDLKKSFLISFLLITLEIFLYFAKLIK